MKKKKTDWVQKMIIPLAAVAALAGGWVLVQNSRHSDLFQKEIMKAPEFSFQDRTGRMFSSSELVGKVWVVDFIFAHCAGSCPVLTQQMKFLQNTWPGNPDLKLVSLTVDPDRDNVKSLKIYADDLKAREDQWFFLTGAKADLYKVIREGFKVTAMQSDEQVPGFDFIHSDRLILVDSKGVVRGLYNGEMPEEMVKLRQDVKFLMSLREKS